MRSSKEARQKAALIEAAKRIGKRALTLSMAMLRVHALSEALDRELATLALRPQDEERARGDALEATKRIENTPFMRADAYFSIMLAALYAVVEKWQEWRFADPTVDALLSNRNRVTRLAKYRHAVFHADYYDHRHIRALATDNALRAWTAQLAGALRSYLRDWHANPLPHIEAHIQRGG